MKKGTRLIKRAISLLLVIILSIESFAAIVSDNDGSAFITKAEFDSLKNEFQSQIDSYNTSIDAKIDGAIAAYLSGIKVSVKNESQVITPSWKYVNFLNKIVNPEFAYPNIRLSNAFALYAWVVAPNSEYQSNNKLVSYDLVCRYSKTWGDSETNLRPLVNVTGDEANHKKYIWNGIANRYVETIVATNVGNYQISDFAYMDYSTSYFRFYVLNCVYLHPFGYDKNLLTKTDFWKGKFKYQNKSFDDPNNFNSGVEISPTSKQSSNVLQAKLEKIKVGTEEIEKRCEHIVQYDGATQWPVSNESFSNTFNTCTLNTKTNKNYADNVSKNNYGRFLAEVVNGKGWEPQIKYGTISLTYENDNTDKIPSVGYIGSKRSDVIYQFKDEIKTILDKKEWKLKDISLSQGLPLHGIKDQYEIEWECQFDAVEWTNASNAKTTDDKREVDLYFSYGPFSNKFETNNPAFVAKDKDGKNINYITTRNRKSTIKITGTKDDIIYVKCIPHFQSTESALKDKFWNVELNLEKSTKVYWTNKN